MLIGNLDTSVNRSYIMGILNVTPDSFSDGGKYNDRDRAIKQVLQMAEDGADIIDVGGESTRPGYTKISDEEEIERITPVIEAIRKECDLPVSVDTYKWKVAKAAIQAGAHMINDIWGLSYPEDEDHQMAKLIAAERIPLCLMHNRPEKMECKSRQDFTALLIEDMKAQLAIAKENGVPENLIILDPGVGFAKGLNENSWSIPAIKDLKDMGYPVLLGISNKSIIGNILDLPVDERTEGTIALNVMGRQYGADFFRVHDVKSNKRALDIADRILRDA